ASLQSLEKYPNDPTKALLNDVRAPIALASRDKVFRAIVTYFYHLSTTQDRYAEMNSAIRTIGRDRILRLVRLILEKYPSGKKAAKAQLGLMETTIAIQGIMTGLFIMASTESLDDRYNFKVCESLAVKAVENLLSR